MMRGSPTAPYSLHFKYTPYPGLFDRFNHRAADAVIGICFRHFLTLRSPVKVNGGVVALLEALSQNKISMARL